MYYAEGSVSKVTLYEAYEATKSKKQKVHNNNNDKLWKDRADF